MYSAAYSLESSKSKQFKKYVRVVYFIKYNEGIELTHKRISDILID